VHLGPTVAIRSRHTDPGEPMRLSTRNQLSGTVTEVTLGSVMATVRVRLDGGDQIVTASITKEAAVELGLAEGTKATVLVKSTEVMLGVD
jgi:molybdopterin-binding protein